MNALAQPHRSSESNLIRLLRERIPDDTYTRPGFTLAISSGISARSGCVEINNGILRVNVAQSSAPDTSINLTGFGVDTLYGLVKRLRETQHYCVTTDGQMHNDHPSIDLKVLRGDFLKGGVTLNHRRFSDQELRRIINLAAQRHNVNYTVATVPNAEYVFVCTLAASDANLIMAQDAVKRRGLSMDVNSLLKMVEMYEAQYKSDTRNQRRAIPVAKIRDSKIERGDVVVGTLYRPSLRTGYQTPNATNEQPEVPILHEPTQQDVQDQQIRISWERIRDTDFYGMELWRDTIEDVKRAQLGNATIASTETQFNQPLPTTASLVFASIGSSTRYGRSVLTQYGEAHGQSVSTFVDGHDNKDDFQFVVADSDAPPPEPNTTYYYRLYVFDANRLASGSNVVRASTKKLRARLSRDPSVLKISPTSAPMAGGTAITIKGTRFHEGMRGRLGDKQLTDLILVDTETATATVPEVFNKDILSVNIDLSITSDTGLIDMAKDVFKYTET